MSISAYLAGITAEHYEVEATDIRRQVAEAVAKGFALVELDLPIGKLTPPRDIIDRAILARVTRGPTARPLLFVRGHNGGLVAVKPERTLDKTITLLERFEGPPLIAAAVAALESAPRDGKSLLREARDRTRSASTTDKSDLAKAILRAWNDGLIRLSDS